MIRGFSAAAQIVIKVTQHRAQPEHRDQSATVAKIWATASFFSGTKCGLSV
jgi:hypothetical protein